MQMLYGVPPVATVLVPDKAPVLVFLVNMETVLSPKLTAYTFAPSAEMQIPQGEVPAAIVLVPDNAPVLVFRVNMRTVLLAVA